MSRTHTYICPVCQASSQRVYIRTKDHETHKTSYDPIGYICSNPNCNHFSIDD